MREGVRRVEGANEVCCRILIFFISTNSLAVSSYNRRPFSFVGFCLWRSTQFVIHDTIMSLALVDNYRKIIFIIRGCDGRTIFILCISCQSLTSVCKCSTKCHNFELFRIE